MHKAAEAVLTLALGATYTAVSKVANDAGFIRQGKQKLEAEQHPGTTGAAAEPAEQQQQQPASPRPHVLGGLLRRLSPVGSLSRRGRSSLLLHRQRRLHEAITANPSQNLAEILVERVLRLQATPERWFKAVGPSCTQAVGLHLVPSGGRRCRQAAGRAGGSDTAWQAEGARMAQAGHTPARWCRLQEARTRAHTHPPHLLDLFLQLRLGPICLRSSCLGSTGQGQQRQRLISPCMEAEAHGRGADEPCSGDARTNGAEPTLEHPWQRDPRLTDLNLEDEVQQEGVGEVGGAVFRPLLHAWLGPPGVQ